MAHKNIHRTVLTRLASAWLLLSLVLGVIVLYLEMGKADALMHDLARTESRHFTDHLNQENLPHLEALRQKADDFLKSGFVSLRIYDNRQTKILDVVGPGRDIERLGIAEHVHLLAPGDLRHHHTYWDGRQPFVQILLPIEQDGNLLGYFEGVYEVNAETARGIAGGIMRALMLVVVVILVTSVALYPVIISLNRGLASLSSELLKSNVELMEVLGGAIAKRDSDTQSHNYRVTVYAIRLAEALGCRKADIRHLISGAFLHDVGKIGISDTILLKPGPLTEKESKVMRTHVRIGMDIISKANWLQNAREVVGFHHEKFDGSGYLQGLKGEAIPLNARIFAIVDVFDALVSRRPYKVPLAFDDARAVMRRGRGADFDPRLLDAFDAIVPEMYSEIGDAEDAVVRETLHKLLSKYYPLTEDFLRGQEQ